MDHMGVMVRTEVMGLTEATDHMEVMGAQADEEVFIPVMYVQKLI